MHRRIATAFLVTFLLYAQSEPPGAVEGIVDSDPAVALTGASVGVDDNARGFHRKTAPAATGQYTVPNLAAGSYTVWAEVPGLGCILYPHVAVHAGEHVRVDFHFARPSHAPGGCAQ